MSTSSRGYSVRRLYIHTVSRINVRKARRLRAGVFLALLLSAGLAAGAESDWPERVVTIEEMAPLTPMRFAVPRIRAEGEVRKPAILRVHVDARGDVRRAVLLESCGSPTHDEAALHAMRSMRFKPKTIDGVATDVTLVVPLHMPLSKRLPFQRW